MGLHKPIPRETAWYNQVKSQKLQPEKVRVILKTIRVANPSTTIFPTKEFEMIIDKLKYLTEHWSLAHDGKDVTLTIDGSQNKFASFAEAETFVEHELDKAGKWPV